MCGISSRAPSPPPRRSIQVRPESLTILIALPHCVTSCGAAAHLVRWSPSGEHYSLAANKEVSIFDAVRAPAFPGFAHLMLSLRCGEQKGKQTRTIELETKALAMTFLTVSVIGCN